MTTRTTKATLQDCVSVLGDGIHDPGITRAFGINEFEPGGDDPRDVFAEMRDDETTLLARMGPVINRRKEVAAIRKRGFDAAPLTLLTGSRADEILASSVSYALTVPSFAHLVCEVFIDQLREKMEWRFDETAKTVWRQIFIDRFVEEELIATTA